MILYYTLPFCIPLCNAIFQFINNHSIFRTFSHRGKKRGKSESTSSLCPVIAYNFVYNINFKGKKQPLILSDVITCRQAPQMAYLRHSSFYPVLSRVIGTGVKTGV